MSKLLTEDDYIRASDALECDVAAIKAVCEVEAPRGGFLPSGEPAILFEAHHFARLTGKRYNDSHPHISSATWNRALYKGGQAEHARLAEASALDRDAALQSASWGKFQIMGFNWYACNYSSLQNFINAMYRSEGDHLDAFVGFVKSNRLDSALRDHRWADFARGYNGAGYAANQYDTKLAAAWRKYA
jgi:hypothetical protein